MGDYERSIQPIGQQIPLTGTQQEKRFFFGDEGIEEYSTPTGPSTQPTPLPMPNRADFTTMSDPDKWTATTQLTPEGQKIFDLGLETDIGSAELGLSAIGQMGETFADPFTIGGETPGYQGPRGRIPGYQGPGGAMPGFQGPEGDMPKYGEHRQQVMDAMLARTNTDIGRDRERVSSRLIAQGIPPGSEA